MKGDGSVDWELFRQFQCELDYLDLVRMERMGEVAASWQHASCFNNDWRAGK